jgi:tRNA dimethylallyltransferase
MKKILLIAGQTGVGKTQVAYELASKLNGEIVLIDSIQTYKHLNIVANKPSKIQQKFIKYHNLSIYDINIQAVNAMNHIENIRKIVQNIWDRNKIPILEGGCFFYIKMFLTNTQRKFRDEEQLEVAENILVAREIIKRDQYDFKTTFQRLRRIDSSIPEDIPIKNDFYRLEKRLADAITFGDGAYDIIKQRERIMREESTFLKDVDLKCFMLYNERNAIIKKLETRTEKMLKDGLIDEVIYLLNSNLITPDIFCARHNYFSFLNAFGLLETINYFGEIIKNLDNKTNILHSLKNATSDFLFKSNICVELLRNLLNQISINNRQYAKAQTTSFKSIDNFIWIHANKNLSDISNEIIKKYLSLDQKDFLALVNSNENISLKNPITTSIPKRMFSGNFTITNDRLLVKLITEKAFDFCESNKEKIEIILKNLKIKNSVSETENEETNIEDSNQIIKKQGTKLDIIKLEKYLKI